MQIADSRFLITGASRGIGRALAETLLGAGARVVISGRDEQRLEEARATLAESAGERVRALRGDVAVESEAAHMVDYTVEHFGGLDAVVNNAAILSPPAPILETPADTWREVLEVNVVGTVNVIRQALPALEANGGGLIVNLSSTWGRTAARDVAPYCASKFAVEALTQSLAAEVPAGIVAVALNPGIINTAMLACAFQSDVSAYPSPASLGPAWLALFERADASWNGRSLDLATLA